MVGSYIAIANIKSRKLTIVLFTDLNSDFTNLNIFSVFAYVYSAVQFYHFLRFM